MTRRTGILGAAAAVVVVVVALPLTCDRERSDLDDSTRARVDGSFALLADGVTYYQVEGPADGPRVVLVHGFSVPSFCWEAVAGRLAGAGFRVLRYDLFGRGWSDRPDTAYGIELYDRQLVQLLDELGWTGPVDLVAMSMGGTVSVYFAGQHPERTGKLALLAPYYFHEQPFTATLVQLPVVGSYLTSVFGEKIMVSRLRKNFNRIRDTSEIEARFVEQMNYHGYKRALQRTSRDLHRMDFGEAYRAGTAGRDVLLVWGTDDRVLPYPQHETILSHAPGAQLVTLDGQGHMAIVEDPDLVTGHLVGFLRPSAEVAETSD